MTNPPHPPPEAPPRGAGQPMEAGGPAAPLQRTRGTLRLGFRADDGRTRVSRFYQEGAARARLPAVAAGTAPEAVLMNTAGGLTGGDRMRVEVGVEDGASAVVTTQASEKIYRASEGVTRIGNRITVGRGARLEWLPQETIVFDRARLRRTLEVDLSGCSHVLLAEAMVFGRTAMGETLTAGGVHDGWRIRRDGRLVFADGLSLEGEDGVLEGPTALDGGCALATVVLVSPDAEATLGAARVALEGRAAVGGASAWDGLLTARLAAVDGASLRAALLPLLTALRGGRRLPTVWHC